MKKNKFKNFWNENKHIVMASVIGAGIGVYFNFIKEEKSTK